MGFACQVLAGVFVGKRQKAGVKRIWHEMEVTQSLTQSGWEQGGWGAWDYVYQTTKKENTGRLWFANDGILSSNLVWVLLTLLPTPLNGFSVLQSLLDIPLTFVHSRVIKSQGPRLDVEVAGVIFAKLRLGLQDVSDFLHHASAIGWHGRTMVS